MNNPGVNSEVSTIVHSPPPLRGTSSLARERGGFAPIKTVEPNLPSLVAREFLWYKKGVDKRKIKRLPYTDHKKSSPRGHKVPQILKEGSPMRKMGQSYLEDKQIFVGLEDSKKTWQVNVRYNRMEIQQASMPADY